MNITIDIRCLMNPNYSGVAQYTHNLLTQLFKIDKQNSYKLFYNSSRDIVVNLPKFDYPNVKFYGFKYPNKLLNAAFLFLNYPEIEKLVNGCDLFFIPNPNFCALEGKGSKVITIHDLSFELYPDFFSPKQRLWHKAIRPKKLIVGSKKVIAVSANTKKDIINLFKIEAEKIKVIYPGLDHDKYKIPDKDDQKFIELTKKYNLPKNFLLYLGTLEPRKNIEGIIEAFNLLKAQNENLSDLQLIIAGSKGWKYKHIFETAQKSAFTEQIHFIGFVEENEKPYLYNLARLFLFPSFYEGFGLPVLEAQACGTPVITSINSSFLEVVANSALLVNPDNINEIADAASQILTDSILRETIITKGLKNSQRFSWTKCAQETLDCLISESKDTLIN